MLKLLQAKLTYVRIEVIVITIKDRKKKTWKGKTFTETATEISVSLTNQLKAQPFWNDEFLARTKNKHYGVEFWNFVSSCVRYYKQVSYFITFGQRLWKWVFLNCCYTFKPNSVNVTMILDNIVSL